MRTMDIPAAGRRRQRRRMKQRGYSEAYRQKLSDANCPDRDDIAAAAIRVVIQLVAEKKPGVNQLFFEALRTELEAKGFSGEASMEKLKSMVITRRRKLGAG